MKQFFLPLFILSLLFSGCFDEKKNSQETITTGSGIYSYAVVNQRPAGWSDETHGKDASANYSVVFPQDSVNRMDITISADQWQALMDDMTQIYGYSFGQGGGMFPGDITGSGMFPGEVTGGGMFPGNITGCALTNVGIDFGGGNMVTGGNSALSIYLTSSEVGEKWPLIRYLMDDSVYRAKYNQYVKEVVTGAFNPSAMQLKYTKYASLIKEFVVGENGETADATYVTDFSSFDQAIETLKSHVTARESAVNNYLINQK